MIEEANSTFELTSAEIADHPKIRRSPIPDRMLSVIPESSDRQRYIWNKLEWFHRTLSKEAHHSWSGLARPYPLLVPDQLSDDAREQHLE